MKVEVQRGKTDAANTMLTGEKNVVHSKTKNKNNKRKLPSKKGKSSPWSANLDCGREIYVIITDECKNSANEKTSNLNKDKTSNEDPPLILAVEAAGDMVVTASQSEDGPPLLDEQTGVQATVPPFPTDLPLAPPFVQGLIIGEICLFFKWLFVIFLLSF